MDGTQVSTDRFDAMVCDALDALPPWVLPIVSEITVTTEDLPAGSLPDSITLYRLPVLASCREPEDVPGRVLTVLGHEVGHALGLSDERLRELGWY